MLKKIGKSGILVILILAVTIFFSNIVIINNINPLDEKRGETPETAAIFDAASIDNIEVTEIDRKVNMSGYGLLNVEDEITFKNLNNNPITGVFFAVSEQYSDDLVFYEAKGAQKQSLLVEKTDKKIDTYELFAVYFNSPLLPTESRKATFVQSYKDITIYTQADTSEAVTYLGDIFPSLPYKATGDIIAKFKAPESASLQNYGWGTADENNVVTYNFEDSDTGKNEDYLEPYLGNMAEDKSTSLSFTLTTQTKIQVQSIEREISISPWGIIQVKEEYLIQNLGNIDITQINLQIPGPAEGLNVYDDLGELTGTELFPETNYTELEYKDLTITLTDNRVKLTPTSKFRFTLEYHLPYEKYFNLNWLQHSCEIDTLTSKYEYLGKDQTTEIVIEGAFSLDSVTANPNNIEKAVNYIKLSYSSEYITPYNTEEVQITFTINLFDMLLRPIVLMLLFASIGGLYVLIIKSQEREVESAFIVKQDLPISEIREFCVLYEEKLASMLEMRRAQEARKRKKLSKRRYRNLIEKNKKKIEELNEEIKPFKQDLREINETFANIIKKLDFLEAESLSVKDSLRILRARYRKGRLPSKKAYLRLTDQLMRRRKKIDRNMNKLITQLRSYLL